VAVLDVPIHLRNGGLIIVGLLSVAISGVTLGFALSGLFVLTRHAVHLTAALTYPVFIFGGLIVPTSLLPGPFRWPSHLINLYWANRFVAAAVQGSFDAKSLADLLLLSGAYLWTGWWLFARMVDRSRSEGTLDLV
jgi:ABC-2 type transport system permease protein